MVYINRIEQLFGLIIIAYTRAYLVGIAANIKVKTIRVLSNGRRTINIVKYCLNFIADTLFNPFRPKKSMRLNCCHVLSSRFYNLMF